MSLEQETFQSYQKIAISRSTTHNNREYWRNAFEHFKLLLPQGKVIDVGCGNGRDASLFLQANYDYIGIDYTPQMVEEARRFTPTARFEVGNMYGLDFPNEYFDGFWAVASMLHIPRERIDVVLGSIKRIVKPRGVGFVVMREGAEDIVREEQTGRRFFALYSLDEFASILERNGYDILTKSREERGTYNGKRESNYITYHVMRK